MAKRPERLPPLTDATMGGQVTDAVATDRLYNEKAIQINGLLDWIECVRTTVNSGQKPDCQGGK